MFSPGVSGLSKMASTAWSRRSPWQFFEESDSKAGSIELGDEVGEALSFPFSFCDANFFAFFFFFFFTDFSFFFILVIATEVCSSIRPIIVFGLTTSSLFRALAVASVTDIVFLFLIIVAVRRAASSVLILDS